MKLEILYKPVIEFRTRNDIAIHTLKPTYNELLGHIDAAVKDGFPRIVAYVDDPYIVSSSRFNIHASQSTWNRLRRDLNADVRCGEVGFRHGSSAGDGFEIYFEEE